MGKFFTDPIWWVYLFWMPDFLNRNLGLNLAGMRLPLFVIYSGACVGSIGGGWLSSSLLKRGWAVNASRKTALLVCALAVTPIMIAAHTQNAWLAVFLIAIAAGAHQGWSANIYTLVSDMFPRKAVGSVVGFGTMAGAIGGMLVAKVSGLHSAADGVVCAGVRDGRPGLSGGVWLYSDAGAAAETGAALIRVSQSFV